MLKYSQVRRQVHLLVVLMHIQMFVRSQSVQSQQVVKLRHGSQILSVHFSKDTLRDMQDMPRPS